MLSGSGAIGNWYAYGLGPNDALNQMNVASATRATFIPDIQGSFIGSLDASSGTLSKFGYQTYGETPAPNSTFAYTGQRIDPETGLYYYRARMYSPAWGRFPQTDPIGYVGGNNLYRYVKNDPVNLTDAFGTAPDNPEASGSNSQFSAENLTNGTQIGGPDLSLASFQAAFQSESATSAFDFNEMSIQTLVIGLPGLTANQLTNTDSFQFSGSGTGGELLSNSNQSVTGAQEGSVGTEVADISSELEALGGGTPTLVPTPKGATQFIFPNGMILRFDLAPGQYSPAQGPHINLQPPGGGNIHIPLQP
ncbi:MAG: RHS repeat-associated core domain-containing protein [Xanthobacteraceae bacterium]